jgi:hypothetical protein
VQLTDTLVSKISFFCSVLLHFPPVSLSSIKSLSKLYFKTKVEAGYSQWRKVFLVHELIRNSGIKYTLILRARPDATILEPLDLRLFERDMAEREPTKKARGHYIVIPERSRQVITDHMAMGTPETMYLYAKQAFPYVRDCCEGYVWRNLEARCFSRSDEVLNTEYISLAAAKAAAQEAEKDGPNREHWAIVPREVRKDKWSPILLTSDVLWNVGRRACLNGANSRCVPIYRTRFTYIFRVNVAAWFAMGALCMRQTNEGHVTGPFLYEAGIASVMMPEIEKKFNDGPCVRVPSTHKAWNAASAYINSLAEQKRLDLLQARRRRVRREI